MTNANYAIRALLAAGLAAIAIAASPAGAQLADVSKYPEVPFDALSAWDYLMPDPYDTQAAIPKNVVPKSVLALNGKRIAITGFMLPINISPAGVTQFMLNASLDMCYFGAPVRLNDWIMVTMKGTKKAKFSHLPTTIYGTFEVGEVIKNGRVMSLYRMTADDAQIKS